MILKWLRRYLRGFHVEDEVRKLLDNTEHLNVPESNPLERDIAEDDRRYEEVRRHTDEANSALYRLSMQRTLRLRRYHRNGA